MRLYVHRIVAGLTGVDVLTHALPYEARLAGRSLARRG